MHDFTGAYVLSHSAMPRTCPWCAVVLEAWQTNKLNSKVKAFCDKWRHPDNGSFDVAPFFDELGVSNGHTFTDAADFIVASKNIVEGPPAEHRLLRLEVLGLNVKALTWNQATAMLSVGGSKVLACLEDSLRGKLPAGPSNMTAKLASQLFATAFVVSHYRPLPTSVPSH